MVIHLLSFLSFVSNSLQQAWHQQSPTCDDLVLIRDHISIRVPMLPTNVVASTPSPSRYSTPSLMVQHAVGEGRWWGRKLLISRLSPLLPTPWLAGGCCHNDRGRGMRGQWRPVVCMAVFRRVLNGCWAQAGSCWHELSCSWAWALACPL